MILFGGEGVSVPGLCLNFPCSLPSTDFRFSEFEISRSKGYGTRERFAIIINLVSFSFSLSLSRASYSAF